MRARVGQPVPRYIFVNHYCILLGTNKVVVVVIVVVVVVPGRVEL